MRRALHVRWCGLAAAAVALLSWSACGGDFATLGNPGAGGGDTQTCNADTDCLLAESPCLRSYCGEDGKCRLSNVRQGPLPDVFQTVGDCEVVGCDGQGTVGMDIDDGDVPVDGNPCTRDVCESGAPSNPPAAVDTPCGNGLACNGAGQCAGCNESTQCGESAFCFTWECTAQKLCEQVFTAAGTPLPDGEQTPEDCLELRCDGAGQIAHSEADDPPQAAPRTCGVWVCDSGMPITADVPDNTSCGTSAICCGGACCPLSKTSATACVNGGCPPSVEND